MCQTDNAFEAAFAELRARNAHLDDRATIEMNGTMFWQLARYWFMQGANAFQTEVVNEEALRGPLSMLRALATTQDQLNAATSALFVEIMPGTRH